MDFTKDASSRHLIRLCGLDLPDFVKEAAINPEAVADLPDSAFADPARRQHPIDTAGHTWLSAGYIASSGDGLEHMPKVKRAAELHGVGKEVDEMVSALNAPIKQAAARPNRFALTVDFAGSQNSLGLDGTKGFYPINDLDQLEKSALQLGNDKSRIPIDAFAAASVEIVKAAKELGARPGVIPPCVLQYGEDRLPDWEFITKQADRRTRITGDQSYRDIAATARHHGCGRQEFAELWQLCDSINGLKTGSAHLDAWDIYNSGVKREAKEGELSKWASVAGNPVPVEAIAGLKEACLKRAFGGEALERVSALVKAAAHQRGAELDATIAGLGGALQKSFLKVLVA